MKPLSPFARLPKTGSYWPVKTNHSHAKVVPYKTINGKIFGRGGRIFMANRSNKKRYHAGIDLYAKHRDPVIACEDGRILKLQYFYKSKAGESTFALFVKHGDIVINYGEVKRNSLTKNGLKEGDYVRAGQVIGFVSTTQMLHFETYQESARKNYRWYKKDRTPPSLLLNPTKYLLKLKDITSL